MGQTWSVSGAARAVSVLRFFSPRVVAFFGLKTPNKLCPMGGWLFWCRFWGVAKTFSKTPRVVAFFGLKTPRVVAFLWPKMARAVPPPPGCCLALLRGCAVRALRVRGGWLRRGAAWARVWTRRVLRVLDFGQRSCRCSCAWARSMFRPSCESCAQRAVRARAAFLNFGFCKMFFAKLTGVGGAQVRGAAPRT